MPGGLVSLVWSFDPTLDAPPRYRRACAYEAFVPEPLARLHYNLSAETAGTISEAEAAIRDLNQSGGAALRPLAHLLLRTESIASSKIEGMQAGIRELARAEARMESGGKVGPTAAEVLGNMSAMELAVHEAANAERCSVDQILAIHRRLMERAANNHIAGQIRTGQNWIGGNNYNPCGADFVPPPPVQVARLLNDLCEAANSELLPPLVQAALVHAQFETIHPFDDGNGRTGRALIHVILRRRGLAPSYVPPISVILAGGRDRYIAGLTAFRGDGVERWIDYFAAAAGQAAKLAKRYLQAVQELTNEWRAQLKEGAAPRADAAAWAIINVLPAFPVITAPVAIAATGRGRAPVYEALTQLQEAGVLVPLSAARRNQSWEAVGLLDLLARLEAGQLPG